MSVAIKDVKELVFNVQLKWESYLYKKQPQRRNMEMILSSAVLKSVLYCK